MQMYEVTRPSGVTIYVRGKNADEALEDAILFAQNNGYEDCEIGDKYIATMKKVYYDFQTPSIAILEKEIK